MQYNFLCYTRSEIIMNDTLQYIKSKFNDLYCDFFDNKFCQVKGDIRQFSNKGIGFCLDKLLNSNSIYYIDTKQNSTLFTQLELLIALHYGKKVNLLDCSTSGNFEISACENIRSYVGNILENNNTSEMTFLAYNRNTNNYRLLLKRFKKICKNDMFIDCLDNKNLREANNRSNYALYNKSCTYSTSIFDEVFNKLVKSRTFCFIDSPNIFKNDFVRLQYIIAKILNKEIFHIAEEDFFGVINNKTSFDKCIKLTNLEEYDAKFCV